MTSLGFARWGAPHQFLKKPTHRRRNVIRTCPELERTIAISAHPSFCSQRQIQPHRQVKIMLRKRMVAAVILSCKKCASQIPTIATSFLCWGRDDKHGRAKMFRQRLSKSNVSCMFSSLCFFLFCEANPTHFSGFALFDFCRSWASQASNNLANETGEGSNHFRIHQT
jgi:hypothetical protein